MNDELQEQLAKMLERSMEVAEQTGTWALDKAPDLIHQFLIWELWSSVFFCLFGFIFFAIAIKVKNIVLGKEGVTSIADIDDADAWAFLLILGGANLFVGSIFVFKNLYNAIHVLVAPEIYLIKYFL